MNEHKLNAALGCLMEASNALGRTKHLKRSEADAATVAQNLTAAQDLLLDERRRLEAQREQVQAPGRRAEVSTAAETLTFSQALEVLKAGGKVTRAGWNGQGMWLRRYDPYLDEQFKTSESVAAEGTLLPWIGMKTADNSFVPWLASHSDLLASDWQTVGAPA